MSILVTHEQLLLRSYTQRNHLCDVNLSLLFTDEAKKAHQR